MNRYGRHGTRAWLRRYLRRREEQQETSTALVAAKPFIPVVVFNITVPAGVGKVVIIVSDPSGNNTTVFQKDILDVHTVDQAMRSTQYPERNTDKMQNLPPGNKALIKLAEVEAYNDVQEIAQLVDSSRGRKITVNKDKRERKVKQSVKDKLNLSEFLGVYSNTDEYENIIDSYVAAYLTEFEKQEGKHPSIIRYAGKHSQNLRSIAISDKGSKPSLDNDQIQCIAVARSMSVLGINFENTLDRIEEIQPLAKDYIEYFFNGQDEEEWPGSQEAFRGNGRY